MTISRRSFLSGVAPAIAFAAASGALQASSATRQSGSDLREDVFRPLIGSSFDVHEDTRRRGTVSLVDVVPLDAKKNRTRHAFTLHFQQTKGAPIAQGTYRFSHARGEFLLFVVAGARSATHKLTAVINRA